MSRYVALFHRLTGLFGILTLGACAAKTGATLETPTPPGATRTSSKAATPARADRPVVVVTVDGLIPDAYIHPEKHGLRIPTLRALMARGAASNGIESVFPTLTYPAHTTIATGVVPAKHGIVSNRSFDPLENDLEGWRWYAEEIRREPIWRIAQRHGYDTALIHWPVTVGAQVRWVVPEYWRAKNEQDTKLLRVVSTPGLLESVAKEYPDFWSRYVPPAARDDALTDIAIHVLTVGKPQLLMLHLIEVDAAQHRHGVWSPEAIEAIESDDRQLARIVETLSRLGIADQTILVVLSDHGFMNAAKMVRPCVLLSQAGLISTNGNRITDWKATVLVNSGQAYVYLRDAKDTKTRDRVREAFADQVRQKDSGIGRLYEADDVLRRGGDPNAFLALEAAPDYQFGAGCIGDYVAPPSYRATHGFDPQRPELRASLIVAGPGIAHGTIANARLVDIAPSIAGWLGLEIPDVDGTRLMITPSRQ